jgi:hypothetical protein
MPKSRCGLRQGMPKAAPVLGLAPTRTVALSYGLRPVL